MEILDIVDENGKPKGKTVEREKAHAEGIMHRTSHVWLLRKRSGKVQVLLQKRCETKETFPGCYDISSAGHIPAGMDFAESAIRELKEELGITASADELILCGDRIAIWDDNFHGKPFHDRLHVCFLCGGIWTKRNFLFKKKKWTACCGWIWTNVWHLLKKI